MPDVPDHHPTPHDALFKRVFHNVENGSALLRSILPEPLVRGTDWGSLRLESETYVDEELRGLMSDLVFSVELEGSRGFFCLLVEHQSTPEAAMAWRLLRYTMRVWERHPPAALPFVFPVVVYHGERPWTAAQDLAGLVDLTPAARTRAGEWMPRFRYLLDDLTQLDVDGLRQRGMPAMATLALWALRSASDRGFVQTASELADLFQALRAADDGREALRTLFSYLAFIARPDEGLVEAIASQLDAPLREEIMELEEMLAHKMRAEGRVEGRAEGRVATLLKQVQLKFGEVPAEAVKRIETASETDLERWIERILTAPSLDELLG